MRRAKIFYITAMLCSVFVLFLYSVFYFKSMYTQEDTVSFYELTSNWSYQNGNETVFTDTLPSTISADESSSATISGILPDTILDTDVLQFHSTHKNVWVAVDGTLIYDNTAERFRVSKTPGNVCHFIPLDSSMAGKSFSITYQNCYGGDSVQLYPVLFGNEQDITFHLVTQKLPAFIICVLMFTIGVIALVCYAIFSKRLASSASLLWLALFAIAFSCWSGFETKMMTLILPYHLAFSWFTFVSLKFILIPIIVFVNYSYQIKQSRWSNLLISLSGVDIITTSVLQYLGIMDFKETLLFTHILFLLCIVWILAVLVAKYRELRKNYQEEPKKIKLRNLSLKQMHILFIPVLTITVILDFASYYFMLHEDSARFSRIALIIYIIGLSIMIVQNSLDLQKRKEKEEDLREMAVTDPLTKLKNRASFEKDIAAISAEEQFYYGIAMFDLNKLKYFNDVHGHSMGDYYIIICSEILQDIFCSYGNIYRIGGDEFCAVLKNITPEKYEQLSPLIASRLQALHQPIFEYRMEVADGYASFDSKLDHSLTNTMERADTKMYTKKQAMKAAAQKEHDEKQTAK